MNDKWTCGSCNFKHNQEGYCAVCGTPFEDSLKADDMKEELFNPSGTWMDNVNPSLLRRLWDKKGRPGVLRTTTWGITAEMVDTPWGVLSVVRDPLLRTRK